MDFNKIRPNAFRELQPNECRILFLRHAEHEGNITLPEEIEKLTRQGAKLKAACLIISGAVGSPADRAISAVYLTKAGTGRGGYTRTDDRLADMKAEGPKLIAKLKAEAKTADKPAEEFIFNLCQTDADLRTMMIRRGNEGSDCLRASADNNVRKTILAGSHGGSRMEVTIAALRERRGLDEKNFSTPKIFVQRGQIVELILTESGELIEVNYLEPPRNSGQCSKKFNPNPIIQLSESKTR